MSKQLSDQGFNDLYTIDDLPFTRDQKELVLEWYAQKIWTGLSDPGHCKSYDPLVIEGRIAHSYIFNLGDGGRHHEFKSLAELEELLVNEMREYATVFPEGGDDE